MRSARNHLPPPPHPSGLRRSRCALATTGWARLCLMLCLPLYRCTSRGAMPARRKVPGVSTHMPPDPGVGAVIHIPTQPRTRTEDGGGGVGACCLRQLTEWLGDRCG